MSLEIADGEIDEFADLARHELAAWINQRDRDVAIEHRVFAEDLHEGAGAQLVLPPTSSVDAAAARLAQLRHGGRTPLAEGLTARGWEIEDVTAYRTVRAAPPAAEIREMIKTGGFDAVCFTSSSTVRNLVGIAGKPHARTLIACIGPRTAENPLPADVAGKPAQVHLQGEKLLLQPLT